MSATGSALINDLGNGLLFCKLCETQIKSKVLTAHVNGRKHRDAMARFKQGFERAASIQQQQNTGGGGGVKRTISADGDNQSNDVSHVNGRQSIPSKKVRTSDGFDGAVDSLTETKKIAKDKLLLFGQSEEYQVKSPWQIEAAERKNLHLSSTPSSSSGGLVENVIEGLPDGFFDDKQLNSRVREAMDKQKRIDSELNRFFQEVADIDVQRQEKDEELVETSAIRHDLEEIDEQLDRWRAVNELELRKEQVEAEMKTRFQEHTPNFDAMSTSDNEEDESTVDDSFDWRTRLL